MAPGMRFKIDVHIIIIKRRWYYKIIYPDNTSELCFLYKTVSNRVGRFIPTDIEMFSWKNL